MTDYELGYSLPMTDKSQRVIAALEVEAAMAEAHAKRLSSTAPNLADPERQREIAALVKEETDRAQTSKRANPPAARPSLKSLTETSKRNLSRQTSYRTREDLKHSEELRGAELTWPSQRHPRLQICCVVWPAAGVNNCLDDRDSYRGTCGGLDLALLKTLTVSSKRFVGSSCTYGNRDLVVHQRTRACAWR
jgi:hypothetical protein